MSFQRLFDKCPVLPVDASISIARYLRSIRQTGRQSSESENEGDFERAALLQIRILQLICKTLPAHPEYELSENRPVVKELRGIAHTSLSSVERLAGLMNEGGDRQIVGSGNGSVRTKGKRRLKDCHIEISMSLLELFEKVAAENTANGFSTIGILARRGERQGSGEPSSKNEDDGPESICSIAALVIPAQTALPDRSNIRYETDITHLLSTKGLAPMGYIQLCPNLSRLALNPISSRMLARYQKKEPDAVAIIVAPQDPMKVQAFTLTDDYGLEYVLSCADHDISPAENVIPRGLPGEGGPIWRVDNGLQVRKDGEPQFKLYDLRPLAAARDEHERNAK